MPIKSIADKIGYAHAANFTIAFTRSFGNPPMYYRTARR
jgi:AraC-like DNA-binding protein